MPIRTDRRGALALIPLIVAMLSVGVGCDSNPNAPSASRKLNSSITSGAAPAAPPGGMGRKSRND